MATTDNTAALTTLSAGFAVAAQSTISFISQQITASLPAEYASAITAQFAGAQADTGQTASPVQFPTFSSSDAASAAIGTALAQPTLSFIREQISSFVPSEYADAITSQFPTTSAGGSQGSPSVQPSYRASSQFPLISDELRQFFAAQYAPTT